MSGREDNILPNETGATFVALNKEWILPKVSIATSNNAGSPLVTLLRSTKVGMITLFLTVMGRGWAKQRGKKNAGENELHVVFLVNYCCCACLVVSLSRRIVRRCISGGIFLNRNQSATRRVDDEKRRMIHSSLKE